MLMTDKHYRIGEFAQQVGLSTYTLRYYEQEGLLLPQRDENAQRYYTDADVRWLIFILHLKGTGMSMAQLKQYVQLRAQGDGTIPERLALLRDVRSEAESQIRALKNNLAVLNHKVDWYQGKVDSTIAEDESFEAYLKRIDTEDK
jgi:DNA-binding transcriptional MerR regulator